MKWGKVDAIRERARMHSPDTEVEMFKDQIPSDSALDDLDEEEFNRLLEALERTLAVEPKQAD